VINGVYVVFTGVVIAFVFGLFLRRMYKSYGAGDIKMMVVLSAAFTLTHPHIITLILVAIIYIIISFFHILVVDTIRKFVNRDFTFGTYQVKEHITKVPEAVPLAITTVLWFLINW